MSRFNLDISKNKYSILSMANRKISFVPGEYYHIYNRGTNKGAIFSNQKDYDRFEKSLFVLNSTSGVKFSDVTPGLIWVFDRKETLVNIGAYCLMPNHFHILIQAKTDKGASTFMQKLLTSYSMYFNIKYERTGRLFEGTFKSEHVDNDRYLKYLFAYIHLNPIKIIQRDWREVGLRNSSSVKKYLDNYTHSSYIDYAMKKDRMQELILNKESFPRYFQTRKSFRDFIEDWLTVSDVQVKPGHLGIINRTS
ncbi:MAG: transposase [bacterium]|nr:transposase [bacterium]